MPLTLKDQHAHCEGFFRSCMGIFYNRGVEYAPEDVPLVDVFQAAVDERISILTVLRVLMNKHLTAIRHRELTGGTLGPAIQERFRDVANFIALQSFYLDHQTELHETWRNHSVQSYRCVCDDEKRAPGLYHCQRCRNLNWLAAHPPSTKASPPASAPLD